MNNKYIFSLALWGIAFVFVITGFVVAFGSGDNVALPPPDAEAASVDMFLKLGDIKGESSDKGHKDEIEILSWSWGMSQSGSSGTGGGRAGRVSAEPFSFTKRIDKATARLMLSCANGRHFDEAKFSVRRGKDSDDYLVYTFSNVVCSSFHTGGGGEPISEQVSLNFSKVKVEYKPQGEKGSTPPPISSEWDFETGSEG